MILGAIDIGSNAARLCITEVITTGKEPVFNQLNLVRVPLRLGFDVFEKGIIGAEKQSMLLHTMQSFASLMQAYHVQDYRAYATSAMRDAKNSAIISKKILESTGIKIEVITGDVEALIVFENHIAETMDANHSYMYIDVGGGSTECSIFAKGALTYKQSFNIGTIRLLKKLVKDAEWDFMKNTIKDVSKNLNDVIAIGSGGNINKLFNMSKKKEGKPLTLEYLKDHLKDMSALSIAERMNTYGFREDRADVIVPALEIYTSVMRWSKAKEILVPQIGLVDGIIHHLYDEMH